MKKIKHSDITFHGRNLYGFSVFSCLLWGRLASFRTDRQGRDARRAAREYFQREAGLPVN